MYKTVSIERWVVGKNVDLLLKSRATRDLRSATADQFSSIRLEYKRDPFSSAFDTGYAEISSSLLIQVEITSGIS